MHFYKSKGTRESIKALLRSYGVNDNFVRIKEFGHTPDVGIQTHRIHADKSVNALGFASGSAHENSVSFTSSPALTQSATVEIRVRFPLTSSDEIPATRTTGSIWNLAYGGDVFVLRYEKDSVGSHTGTLFLSSSDGFNEVQLTGAGIFNNDWYNIAAVLDHRSASVDLQVRHIDEDVIDSKLVASNSATLGAVPFEGLGGTGGGNVGAFSFPFALDSGEFWAQEFRTWNRALEDSELDDHALNFQSYGVCDVVDHADEIVNHFRFNEDIAATAGGALSPLNDVVPGNDTASGASFAASINPYKKFLIDYNYIASLDFGWSEDKIRIFDSPLVKSSDFVNDLKIVSLEFNMVDALNEDIVQLMKSLDLLNDAIGFPANRYRVHYDDLEVLKDQYFKRLQGRLNFTVFSNMLEFFDRSFLEMVKRLVPGRAFFMGDEFVVESHMLERPKVTYERRKLQEVEFSPEGVIEVWTRFGRNDDKSGNKFPLFLTGSA